MASTLEELTKWDKRFLGLACEIATWSKDPSTKVGCVVVDQNRVIIAEGYNGFPRGILDDGRLADREQKYPLIVHAEENAVATAARIGARLDGCNIVSTLFPCTRCARLLIQAGITAVVAPREWPDRWAEDMQRSQALLVEAGVLLRLL